MRREGLQFVSPLFSQRNAWQEFYFTLLELTEGMESLWKCVLGVRGSHHSIHFYQIVELRRHIKVGSREFRHSSIKLRTLLNNPIRLKNNGFSFNPSQSWTQGKNYSDDGSLCIIIRITSHKQLRETDAVSGIGMERYKGIVSPPPHTRTHFLISWSALL